MKRTSWIDRCAADVAGKLRTCSQCQVVRKGRHGRYRLPSRQAVHEVLDTLTSILFPGCHGQSGRARGCGDGIPSLLKSALKALAHQAEMALRYQCEREPCERCGGCGRRAREAVQSFAAALPDILAALQDDVQAAYEGDPAAKSPMEVVMSYPALQAIAVYRIAHQLHEGGVPLIPRIMTELAHSRTGIDIHPGAAIGRSFFIDHGTGVVIGETAVLGSHVKLYQGVTLGALSFPKGPDGRLIKGIKRHPEVRDNVTIYAGATILGGNTIIGENSEIGGNVWLTHSVPPNSRVYNVQPAPHVRGRRQGSPGESVSWDPVI